MRRHLLIKAIAVMLAVIACIGIIFSAGCKPDDPSYDTPGYPTPEVPDDTTPEETYTISFNTGVAGITVEPITATAGSKISEPAAPVREGFRFIGWLLNGEAYEFDTMPAANIILKASWVKTYTITFDTGTAEYEIDPIIEPAGTEISAPAVHRFAYYLKYWTLDGKIYEFTVMPDKDITLVAEWMELTNLPAMFIDLADKSGKTLPLSSVTREEYVDSTITLTNTDEEFELNSLKAEFKGRGNGSWTDIRYDKKGYKIKFDKKQSIFGREKNKHWVIIACTNFDDVTMSRNYLAYNMANEVLDGIEYTTPAYWIDVYVNGEYRGVYLLCEHVRVGEGRVDIESDYLTENYESTGYLIEYDAYATGTENVDYFTASVNGVNLLKYPFTVHSPDPEDYATDGGLSSIQFAKQILYIKEYVTEFVLAVLNGDYKTFSELADVDSFVDMYILHELFKNVDTGYSSFYLYKKPNGKLYAGPAWDFDATANGADGRGDRSPTGIYVAGSLYNDPANNFTANEMIYCLYQNSSFKGAVKNRWRVLSPAITEFLDTKLNDDIYEEYKAAMGKNFAKWEGYSQSYAETKWVEDVKALKKWLTARIAFLDDEWQ